MRLFPVKCLVISLEIPKERLDGTTLISGSEPVPQRVQLGFRDWVCPIRVRTN